MVFTVGLTGGIASGKTTVTNYFARKGVTVVDADIIARDVVKPETTALDTIGTHFGKSILTKEGTLNRKKLRDIIFNDSQQKEWLEALLHPIIRQQIVEQLQRTSALYAVLVSPLLLETKQHLLVNRIMVVDVPEKEQILRTMKRDQCTEEQAKSIIKTQLSRKERAKHADDLVDNDVSLPALYKHLEILHQKYLKVAESFN